MTSINHVSSNRGGQKLNKCETVKKKEIKSQRIIQIQLANSAVFGWCLEAAFTIGWVKKAFLNNSTHSSEVSWVFDELYSTGRGICLVFKFELGVEQTFLKNGSFSILTSWSKLRIWCTLAQFHLHTIIHYSEQHVPSKRKQWIG